MIDTDIKKQKEAEWLQQHTLTQEQTKQLILNKLKRAEAMHFLLIKREMPNHKHRWSQSVIRSNEDSAPHLKHWGERAATRMESLVWEEKLVRIKAFFKNRQPKYFRVL